jgi:hypothetical protein
VISTLKIAENSYRPTPTTIRDIVNDILNDLTMAYGSMEENTYARRSNNDYILQEFSDISQIVIESLRSCGR